MIHIQNEYKDVADLDKLPYFILTTDGQDLGYTGDMKGIIDFHTHVNFNYLFGRPADLFSKNKTQTFFPFRRMPLSIEGYSALSFSKKSINTTRWETIRQAFFNNGIGKTHTFPNLEKEMKLLHISKSVILPVDLLNSDNTERILGYKDRLEKKHVLFASVDPRFPGAEKNFEKHIKNGARGLKLHPLMQMSKPSSNKVVSLCKMAGDYGLPVIFHSGWGPLTPKWQWHFSDFNDFENLIKLCQNTTIILGHAGSLNYKDAIKIAVKYENVYLELSGQCPTSIREMIDRLGDDRLLFGSDWPYYPIAFPLAKVLIATEGRTKSREKILKLNAEKLLTGSS